MARDDKGRWSKGQSGNPAGRPAKRRFLSEHLRDLLGDPVSVDDGGEVITNAAKIAAAVMTLAVAGDKWAIDFIATRTEGRPRFMDEPPGDDDTIYLPAGGPWGTFNESEASDDAK